MLYIINRIYRLVFNSEYTFLDHLTEMRVPFPCYVSQSFTYIKNLTYQKNVP